MTHDELLTKLSNDENGYAGSSPLQRLYALRAVVELHKPRIVDDVDILMCDYCDWNSYPCGSIQAIEKELK